MKKLIIPFLALSLTSCIIRQPEYHGYAYPDDYDESMYGAVQDIDGMSAAEIEELKKRGNIVNGHFIPRYRATPKPMKSYHFSRQGGPRRHKDRDLDWANNQPNNNYTIQIAPGENAASVAKLLHKGPKSKRRAQIKLKSGSGYTGLVGSYGSKAEAEAALKSLPAEIKSKANIEQWDDVKPQLKKAAPKPNLSSSGSSLDSNS